MKTPHHLPRRRRPLASGVLFSGRQAHEASAGSSNDPNVMMAFTGRLILLLVIFGMIAVTRYGIMVNPMLPLESLLPLRYAMFPSLFEANERGAPSQAGWTPGFMVELSVYAAVSTYVFHASVCHAVAYTLALHQLMSWARIRTTVQLAVMSMAWAASYLQEYLAFTGAAVGGDSDGEGEVSPAALDGASADPSATSIPYLWTILSHLSIGFSLALLVRSSARLATPRRAVVVHAREAKKHFVKARETNPALNTVCIGVNAVLIVPVQCLISLIRSPAATICLWWAAMMAVEWTSQVSIGGIITLYSVLFGVVSVLLDGGGRVKSQGLVLVFLSVVGLAFNAVTPTRALPFVANSVFSAYLILYCTYWRPTTKYLKGEPLDLKDLPPECTTLGTVGYTLLWGVMVVVDLYMQQQRGWVLPGLGRQLLSINTVSCGLFMIFDMSCEFVHAAEYAVQYTNAASQHAAEVAAAAANRAATRKVVLTVDAAAAAAKEQDAAAAKGGVEPHGHGRKQQRSPSSDDGGEAAAPSNSTTPPAEGIDPEASMTPTSVEDDPPTIAAAGSKQTTTVLQDDALSLDGATSSACNKEEGEGVLASSIPSNGSVESFSGGPSPSAGTTPTTAAGQPQTQNHSNVGGKKDKRSKAEIERERKQWQEAQLQSVLEEDEEAAAKLRQKKQKQEERRRLAAEQKQAEAAAAALRAQRERELKEQLDTEKRERERKAQEERLKRQAERERQEAMRQVKEEADRKARELESRKKAEKERREREHQLEAKRKEQAEAEVLAALEKVKASNKEAAAAAASSPVAAGVPAISPPTPRSKKATALEVTVAAAAAAAASTSAAGGTGANMQIPKPKSQLDKEKEAPKKKASKTPSPVPAGIVAVDDVEPPATSGKKEKERMTRLPPAAICSVDDVTFEAGSATSAPAAAPAPGHSGASSNSTYSPTVPLPRSQRKAGSAVPPSTPPLASVDHVSPTSSPTRPDAAHPDIDASIPDGPPSVVAPLPAAASGSPHPSTPPAGGLNAMSDSGSFTKPASPFRPTAIAPTPLSTAAQPHQNVNLARPVVEEDEDESDIADKIPNFLALMTGPSTSTPTASSPSASGGGEAPLPSFQSQSQRTNNASDIFSADGTSDTMSTAHPSLYGFSNSQGPVHGSIGEMPPTPSSQLGDDGVGVAAGGSGGGGGGNGPDEFDDMWRDMEFRAMDMMLGEDGSGRGSTGPLTGNGAFNGRESATPQSTSGIGGKSSRSVSPLNQINSQDPVHNPMAMGGAPMHAAGTFTNSAQYMVPSPAGTQQPVQYVMMTQQQPAAGAPVLVQMPFTAAAQAPVGTPVSGTPQPYIVQAGPYQTVPAPAYQSVVAPPPPPPPHQ